jgi:NAD(P)-dependent dehydrogenase (short-subunit alcohol dehydrogenase family)
VTASYDFSGQIAVITGGSGGIGKAISERLMQSGAQVCNWDMQPNTAKPLSHFIRVDVTSEQSVHEAMDQTLSKFGKIDIFVNSAGIAGPVANVSDYSLEDWHRVMDINLTGTFLCCRAAVAHMQKNNRGRIVNLASIAGKEGNPAQSAYSASKAGVIALTKSLGKELAKSEIRVNCIAPAMVATELLDQMTAEKRQENFSKIPMGRAGLPEEIASIVAWLSSDDCSFCTGTVFDASGGRATY